MSATLTAFPRTTRSPRVASRVKKGTPASGRAIYFTPDASLIAEAPRTSQAGGGEAGAGQAAVAVSPAPARARLRITKRGRTVLALMIVVPLLALIAALSLNGGGASASSTPGHVHFEHVTVASGETLWQIAEQVAPNSDPRNVVADIISLNNISGANIVAGQSLAIPTQYSQH